MAADLPYEYNGQIAKFLNDPNATLPGGTLLNSQIKTRKQVETELELSRFWAAYTIKIKSLNAAARNAPDGGYASYRSVEELVAEKIDLLMRSSAQPALNGCLITQKGLAEAIRLLSGLML